VETVDRDLAGPELNKLDSCPVAAATTAFTYSMDKLYEKM